MADTVFQKEARSTYRAGMTIDIPRSLCVILTANGVAYCDLFTSKEVPSSLTITASGVTVSGVRGQGSSEPTLGATFRSTARNTKNAIRISFNMTGGTVNNLYFIFLSAGTLTFS